MSKGNANLNTAMKQLTKSELMSRFPRIGRMCKRMDDAVVNGRPLADLLHVIISDKNLAISGAEFRYIIGQYFDQRVTHEAEAVDPSLIKEYICDVHGWFASVNPRCDRCEVAVDEEPIEAVEPVDPLCPAEAVA